MQLKITVTKARTHSALTWLSGHMLKQAANRLELPNKIPKRHENQMNQIAIFEMIWKRLHAIAFASWLPSESKGDAISLPHRTECSRFFSFPSAFSNFIVIWSLNSANDIVCLAHTHRPYPHRHTAQHTHTFMWVLLRMIFSLFRSHAHTFS